MGKKQRNVDIPEWLTAFRNIYPDDKYCICQINGGYYLYERIADDGRKHVYIGALKEDGLHPRKQSGVTPKPCYSIFFPLPAFESSETVYEYGFTKAMIDLCPQSWKDRWPNESTTILHSFILSRSPHSFLQSAPGLKTRHYPGAAIRALKKALPAPVEIIQSLLGNIWLIQGDGESHLSKISAVQREFCLQHNILLSSR